MKTGCIVQARMTSSRLPGKVLKTLDYVNGTTILDSVVERLRAVEGIDAVILACTTNKDDDVLAEYAVTCGIDCYRGSENDVLARFYGAACTYQLDNVIRITSDCPFIDPEVIDMLIDLFLKGGYQYASNCVNRTYPHGLDCEILTFDALEWMHQNTSDGFYREHVTSYITSHYDEFSIGSLALQGEDYSQVRITVDTINDYTLACLVADFIKDKDERFSFRTVLNCFDEHPYISNINSDIMQKRRYDCIEDEVQAAIKLLRMQEMDKAADLLERAI